jgi:hypothetical protein
LASLLSLIISAGSLQQKGQGFSAPAHRYADCED